MAFKISNEEVQAVRKSDWIGIFEARRKILIRKIEEELMLIEPSSPTESKLIEIIDSILLLIKGD